MEFAGNGRVGNKEKLAFYTINRMIEDAKRCRPSLVFLRLLYATPMVTLTFTKLQCLYTSIIKASSATPFPCCRVPFLHIPYKNYIKYGLMLGFACHHHNVAMYFLN